MQDPRVRTRALTLSVIIAAVIAVVAIGWGLATDSRIMLFDGVYTLLGTVLSGVSILGAAVASRPATPRFPFGLESIVPVVVVIQGAALLGTLAYAVVDSVMLILDGGTQGAPTAVVAYGLVTLAACLVTAVMLHRMAPQDDLVIAEVANWKASAILSAVMVIGAGLAIAIDAAGYRTVTSYVDPTLVIVASLVMLPVPMRLIRQGGMEMLEGAPPSDVQQAIEASAEEVRGLFSLGEHRVRASKMGGRLYVEIEYLVEPGQWDVSEEDKVRRTLIDRLAPLGYQVWADIELTTALTD